MSRSWRDLSQPDPICAKSFGLAVEEASGGHVCNLVAGSEGAPRVRVFWIFALVLNVVLNLIFLPGRGAEVAAILSSVTYIVLLAMHMGLFAREAGGYGSMRPRLREVVRFVRVALSRG